MSDKTYCDYMREQEEADLAEALRAVTNNPVKPNGGDFRGQAQIAPEWPPPSSIPDGLPPVKPFSEDLLPGAFRPLVRDISERMQVPIDCPAAAVTVSLAGAVNRRATIQPKVNDTGWIVVPNLWGAIVAPPGFMKTPVIQAATQPLVQIQEQYFAEYGNALSEFEFTKEEADLRRSAWKESFKVKVKKDSTTKLERPPARPDEPILRRLIVNDSTFEALHQTLNNNLAGVLVIRDELTGWWSMLDRDGREGERPFFLEAWNGNTSYTMDRIGRGTIYVPACCISMLGGIQPARLRTYLVDALRDGPNNDGLVQRQQVLVWPDFDSKWRYVDRAPDAASVDRVRTVFERLVAITPDNPVRLRFCADAQDLFVGWQSELEAKVRSDNLHPALTSHLAKYRSLMPSLAALFELADRVHDSVGFVGSAPGTLPIIEVSLEHAQQAAGWCDYLETHARRMYSCMTSPALHAARELADKIRKRNVGAKDGFFSCRDVYAKCWSGLDNPEIVKPALEVLRDAGWVRDVAGEPGPFGGRPASRFQINPRVWQ